VNNAAALCPAPGSKLPPGVANVKPAETHQDILNKTWEATLKAFAKQRVAVVSQVNEEIIADLQFVHRVLAQQV
jgi:hypothetical protein